MSQRRGRGVQRADAPNEFEAQQRFSSPYPPYPTPGPASKVWRTPSDREVIRAAEAEAPPPRLHAKSAADRPAKAIAAEAPSKTAARPQRISRPRVSTAGVRSCTRKRGEATILRVFRCEFAAKGTNQLCTADRSRDQPRRSRRDRLSRGLTSRCVMVYLGVSRESGAPERKRRPSLKTQVATGPLGKAR